MPKNNNIGPLTIAAMVTFGLMAAPLVALFIGDLFFRGGQTTQEYLATPFAYVCFVAMGIFAIPTGLLLVARVITPLINE